LVALAAVVLAGGCSPNNPGAGPAPVSASAPPATSAGGAATEIINQVAVNSRGEPINGYHEKNGDQPILDHADCTNPSAAAVSKDIYRCWPAYYGADVCWPASKLELLCMNNPWAKELHRIRANAPLPQVSPRDTPRPVALLLDDGTHCRLNASFALGDRYDGLHGFYGCGHSPGLDVLAPMNADPIDRATPRWAVKIGADQAMDASSPPPVTHSVQTAWFAAGSPDIL
jgi:hypothetical protein